ncbi:hypothetical protein ACFE04_015682 [Oxalis oulophora]
MEDDAEAPSSPELDLDMNSPQYAQVREAMKARSKSDGEQSEEVDYDGEESSDDEAEENPKKRKAERDPHGVAAMFDVPLDMRWVALAHASKLWSRWKSNINQDYVQPRRLTNPETMRAIPKHLVTTVTQKQWDEFVDYVTSKKRLDYNKKQQEKKKQVVREGVVNPQRSDVWMRARTNANGEPIDKKLIPIFNKINELKALQAQAGLNATKGMLFPRKNAGAQNAEMVRLRNVIADMDNNSQSKVTQELLESNMNVERLTKDLENLKGINQPYIPKFSEDIDPFDQAHEIEPTLTQPTNDDNICHLHGRLNGKLILVAKGRIVADGAELGVVIHFKKLNKDDFKVVITCEVEPDFEVPLATEEIKTMAEALHSFLAWPKKLLTFDPYLDEEVKKHFERQRMNDSKKTNEKEKDNSGPSSVVGKVKEKVAAEEKFDLTVGPSNKKEKLNEKEAAKTTWLDKRRVWAYVPMQIDATLLENKEVYMHNILNDLKEEWAEFFLTRILPMSPYGAK